MTSVKAALALNIVMLDLIEIGQHYRVFAYQKLHVYVMRRAERYDASQEG